MMATDAIIISDDSKGGTTSTTEGVVVNFPPLD